MQHIQDDPIITSNEIEVWQDAVSNIKIIEILEGR